MAHDVGITYRGTPGSCTKLSAWVDADFATYPDTQRSVYGGAVMLGGGAISWFSRVQKVTAAASSESEYVALAKVVKELRFLREVKGFLTPPIDDKIVIREDNGGAIKMATNRFSCRHTRHVDVKHNIVRDAVESGVIQIHYVKPGKQHANVLTKALDVTTFGTLARFLLNARAGSTTVQDDLAYEVKCVDAVRFN